MCVPWPWGGDKCSDRYGVRVGRFQLLCGVDDASHYCPAFQFTMRPDPYWLLNDKTGLVEVTASEFEARMQS